MRCRCLTRRARLARTGHYSACLIRIADIPSFSRERPSQRKEFWISSASCQSRAAGKLLHGLAVMGQLLGAALEPEADNSTADLDHLERRLGDGQQQALLARHPVRLVPTISWAVAAVFSTRRSVVV